jgi:adenylylsulfate reductase subunit A
METHEAIAKIADTYKEDPKAFKKKMKELESEAWEDFLDMTISQAILWASQNVKPEEQHSEIAACEPYFIGSHSGASGAWVSGPEDLDTPYKWGYANMTTVDGLFAAGDASGASSHKFSSGSHAEGRICGKAAIKFIVEKGAAPTVDTAKVEELKTKMLAPMDLFEAHSNETTDPDVNTNYIVPQQFMYRLQKIMDEYAGGVTSAFKTSKSLLERAMELFVFLKEDSEKLAARDLHELMRCWENIHRMWQGEAHVRTVLFREETRWPGYYFRSDTPKMDEENWKCFANCRFDPASGEWEMSKKDVWAVPGV